MSLLNRFIKAPKGDNFRIIENPVKYVGYALVSKLLKSFATGGSDVVQANPSSTVSSQNSTSVIPKP